MWEGFAAFAHRGGAKVEANGGIENTLAAFGHAEKLGYRYFESDIRVSSDGVPFLFHDETLARMCGRPERFIEMPAADLDAVLIDGREHIPRLEHALEAFPGAIWNLDVKTPQATDAALAMLRNQHALPRACLGSFHHSTLTAVRRAAPEAVTSASRREIVQAAIRPARLLTRSPARAWQVPSHFGTRPLVTPAFVRKAHAVGVQVHVWTIDNRAQMEALLDMGVDGLMTDRTDTLRDVLTERGLWQ